MTVKEVLVAMCDASDTAAPKLGIYQATITGAKRRKNGGVQITLGLVTNDLTVNDVMEGVAGWIAIGRVDAIRALQTSALTRAEE